MFDRRPRTLRGIAWTFGGAMAIATVIAATALHMLTVRTIDRQVDRRLRETVADILGPERPPSRDAIVARIALRENGRGADGTGYMLLDEQHRRIAGHLAMVPPPPGASDVDSTDRIDGVENGRALAVPVGDGTHLVVAASTDIVDDFDGLLAIIYAAGFGVSILLFVAGMAAMIHANGTRMMAIRTTAEAIIAGDMDRRLPVADMGGEFALEALTFNHMLDRIAALLANLKHVSDDIAHDVRTPLGKLRNRLVDMADRLEGNGAEADIAVALDQCDHILSLFSAILRISEIEGGHRRRLFKTLRLDEIVHSVIDGFAPAIADGGRTLRAGTVEAVTLQGDRDLIVQMIVNMVENAGHHTPTGCVIAVDVRRQGQDALIHIVDNGAGIAPADRSVALRRFGRLASQPDSHVGFGLGLPLAAAIVHLHGGTMVLDDAQPGLAVIIRIPAPAGH